MSVNTFIVDVDGVMTDGSFLYDVDGKFAKRFSADDHDALLLLKPHMEIVFVSGDHRGFPISSRRIANDMHMPLHLVSTVERLEWIAERYDPARVVYMGDGIFDPYVFQGVSYAITVADALDDTKRFAHHVTSRRGGDRAVAEAALHLLSRYFTPMDLTRPLPRNAETADVLAVMRDYVGAFSAHDLSRLQELLAEDMVLQDWELHETGRPAVLAAMERLFAAAPEITAEILRLHQIKTGGIAELRIRIDAHNTLDVIDVVEIDPHGLIRSVRAFKGAAASVVADTGSL